MRPSYAAIYGSKGAAWVAAKSGAARTEVNEGRVRSTIHQGTAGYMSVRPVVWVDGLLGFFLSRLESCIVKS